MKKSKDLLYLNILNIVACIAVVYLHCNGIVHKFTNTLAWKEALIIEVICYFAVPIFVMITGATLLNYREKYGTKTFFKKRFLKVVIPYIAWSYIYYIIYRDTINPVGFIKELMNGSIEPIFWFFPMIIFIYMTIPILSVLVKEKYEKEIFYIILCILLFQSIISPMCNILNIQYPVVFSYMNGGFGYIIFVFLGYLLAHKDFKKYSKIIYILTILCWGIRYFYTCYYSIHENFINKDLFNYLGIISVIPAIAVFMLVKNIKWDLIISFKIEKVIKFLSTCSFGVYLIHIVLKSKLTHMFHLDTYALSYRLIFPLLLYLLCIIIIFFIKKIPILKKIVP